MYKYEKRLTYPVDIKKKNIGMAKLIITQLGGPNGQLGAFLTYNSQKLSMLDDKARSVLNDIACEELGHAEMIMTMVRQLLEDATIEEIKANGLESYYTEHGKGIAAVDACGTPFYAMSTNSTGDAVADLADDMAAEQKARAIYENLINLTDDPDLLGPLLFLRQREVVHFHRFKELFDLYYKKNKIN